MTDPWRPRNQVTEYEEIYELLQRPEWHKQASCRGMGAEQFYPHQGTKEDPTGRIPNPIRLLCAACPVQPQCLEAGLKEKTGWWGGLSERQRRRLRRQRQGLAEPVRPGFPGEVA